MRILNFGSINIDRVYGVKSFVRAGETADTTFFAMHMGGKGFNQSVALARAGADVWHAGCVGADGEHMTRYLSSCGAHVEYVRTLSVPTGHAVIQVEPSGGNCIFICGGANRAVDAAQAEETIAHFSRGDILLLQNEISATGDICRLAFEKGLRVALNPSPITEEALALPLEKLSFLILNEVEAAALTHEADEASALSALRRMCPEAEIVLTLGSRGSMYVSPGSPEVIRQPAFRVKAVDTTGAGDTFTGYFLAARARGDAPADALAEATKASALQVTLPGAAEAVPTLAQVRAFQP